MIRRTVHAFSVSDFILRLIEARGEPGIFCYRIGVDILSAGRAHLFSPVAKPASWSGRIRNQVACSTLFSIFSARFSTLKD
jgi:hypothetical protein